MSSHHGKKSPPDASDAISLALRLLAKELQHRMRRHPATHLLDGGRESVELKLRIPTLNRDGWVEKARQTTSDSIDEALGRILIHRSVFQPGLIYCLRCASTRCDHAAPTRSTDVFAGYSPSGVPRFWDFGQWLLGRQDSRVDHLYRTPPGLVAHVATGSDLTRDLLPAFRDADSGYHIHGQVAAGWYKFPTDAGLTDSLALTFQIVSTRPREGRRRFGLNLIGKAPGEEPLENLFDRVGEIPWQSATRWTQQILRDIERSTARSPGPTDEQLEKRLDGLLKGLARRLEHQRRSQDRKTRHAQKRHREPERPTRKALADLEQARGDSILVDTRRDTLIVLGERGRAHVFNRAGRLVTSIRYSPDSIDRRRERGVWKPATEEQIGALRKQVSLIHDEGER